MIRVILTDIEGTTSSIDFVHQVLFPYARDHLRASLENAPNGADAGEHVAHARETLANLEGGGDLEGDDGTPSGRHAGF